MGNNLRTKKRIYSLQEALERAQKYCAKQERSQEQMRQKLYDWGLNTEKIEYVIAELISADFLNEERFAKLYARSKFNQKKWGRRKIVQGFRKHKISKYCIETGLKEIDPDTYTETLRKLMRKKWKTIKGKNQFDKRGKLARYLIGKGYESSIVWDEIRSLKGM